MADLTYATFVADYTEFANTDLYPVVTVNRYITACKRHFPLSVWSTAQRADAWPAAVAHCLFVWRKHITGAGRVGPQTQDNVGTEIGNSWRPPPTLADTHWWNDSTYGQYVLFVQGEIFVGPLVSS